MKVCCVEARAAAGFALNAPAACPQVTYCGKLANADGTEGEEFDSSYNKQKKSQSPLVVKAGVGKLIAGWDAALLEMSVGEKAVLTIPPEGAYGAKGMPPKIPPNATRASPSSQTRVSLPALTHALRFAACSHF